MARKTEWEEINDSSVKFLMMNDADRISLMTNIFDSIPDLRDRAILSFFYLLGLRPEELLRMTRADISIRDMTDVMFRLPTVKQGDVRYIVLDRNQTPFIKYILDYMETIPTLDSRLFKTFNSPTNFNKALYRCEQYYYDKNKQVVNLSPYVFRKFRLSDIISKGASTSDVLAWKGGKSFRAVENSYAFVKPVAKFKTMIR